MVERKPAKCAAVLVWLLALLSVTSLRSSDKYTPVGVEPTLGDLGFYLVKDITKGHFAFERQGDLTGSYALECLTGTPFAERRKSKSDGVMCAQSQRAVYGGSWFGVFWSCEERGDFEFVCARGAKILKRNEYRSGTRNIWSVYSDLAYKHIRPLRKPNRLFRDIGASGRGVGGFSGFYQSIAHVRRHSVQSILVTSHSTPLEESQHGNSQASDGRKYGTPLRPPVGRRVIFLYSTIGLLFPGCYFGSKLLDRGRNLVGSVLVAGCFALFAIGLSLIVLCGFPWSWTWWL